MGHPDLDHIREEIAKAKGLKEDKALKALKDLCGVHERSPMVYHALGDALYKAYEGKLELHGKDAAEEQLQQAMKVYRHAVALAPKCIWSRVRCCQKISRTGYKEEAISGLAQAGNITEPDDPSSNDAEPPPEFQGCTPMKRRIRVLQKNLDRVKLHVCSEQFCSLLIEKAGNNLDLLKGAKLLIECCPALFSPYHLAAHANLMIARQFKSGNRRGFLEHTLTHANNSVNSFGDSVVMSLFRARVLFVLARYADSDEECRRGMLISDPRDPRDDEIPLDLSFRSEGETYSERVNQVKRQLSHLLDCISEKLGIYWDSIKWGKKEPSKGKKEWERNKDEGVELPIDAWKVKYEILHFPADALVDAYRESNILGAQRVRAALNFFNEEKKWTCSVCPVAKCLFTCKDPTILLGHLCMKHKDIPFHKLQSFSVIGDDAYGGLGLRKIHDGSHLIGAQEESVKKLYLSLGSTRDMFNAYPPWTSDVEEISVLMKVKQGLLVEMKNKLKRVEWFAAPGEFNGSSPNSSGTKYNKAKHELTQLWQQLLKSCEVDHREKILPFIRLFQRKRVLKLMDEDDNLCGRSGGSDLDIDSIFWPVPMPIKTDEYPEEFVFLEYVSPTDLLGCRENLFSDSDQLEPDPEPELYAYPSWEPGVIPRKLDHEQQGEIINTRKLIIYNEKVPGTGKSDAPALYYASQVGSKFFGSAQINCVITDKKPLQYINLIFELLISCQHPNMLKPLGIWVCDEDPCLGCLIFPMIDGSISEIPRFDLFMEENNTICDFTDQGHHVLRQIYSAIHYVNIHCDLGEAGTPLPLFPLQISTDTVYYLKDAVGEYQIFLGWFNTVNPSQDVNADAIMKGNWNSFGACLETLLSKPTDKEISHLLETLKGPEVNEDELKWEPGLWVVDERMDFIRDVFWSQNIDRAKRSELTSKPCLGVQSFADKLQILFQEKNLANSLDFIRNKVLAHQDGPYTKYPGPKEDIGTRKSTIERFLRKEAQDYMLKLVSEIRQLKWPLISPFRRSKAEYEKWFRSIQQSSATAATGSATVPGTQSTIPGTTPATAAIHTPRYPPGPQSRPAPPPGPPSRPAPPPGPFMYRPPGLQSRPPRPPVPSLHPAGLSGPQLHSSGPQPQGRPPRSSLYHLRGPQGRPPPPPGPSRHSIWPQGWPPRPPSS